MTRAPTAIASLFTSLAILSSAPAFAAPPRVVVSISPIHALVSGVMDGIATPHLLLPASASPHSYALRPSDATRLADAGLVVWVGEGLETFLEKPIRAIANRATVVTLLEDAGLHLRKQRAAGVWMRDRDPRGNGDPGDRHDEHDKPAARDDHDEKGHDGEGRHVDHDHADGDGHRHGEYDPHVWLDPVNAAKIVEAAAAALSRLDRGNAGRYAANAARVTASLNELTREIDAIVGPVRSAPYVVFHDAYGYFEERFGTRSIGAIALNPDRQPGAKRLAELRQALIDAKVVCVFAEPQFRPALVQTVIGGTTVRSGSLDPLGTGIPPGPGAYAATMRGLAENLRRCLSPWT